MLETLRKSTNSTTPAFNRRREAEVQAILNAAKALRRFSHDQMLETANELRRQFSTQAPKLSVRTAFALAFEAIRRTCKVELFTSQLDAALVLTEGAVAEMQTGEGKTFACVPAAVFFASAGRGVHVVTPNPYLAKRDYELVGPAFEALGFSVGLLPERASIEAKRAAYDSDICYGTSYEFGFDYLRDQLEIQHAGKTPLGESLLKRLRGEAGGERLTMQRGLAYAIIDEIDDVLLDDAVSPLILSRSPEKEAPDAAAHRIARATISLLDPKEHLESDLSVSCVQLSKSGQARIHSPDIAVPIDCLLRTWAEYVELALRADRILRRDVHYVIEDGCIRIVDSATGRVFADRTWQEGLHQAIEAKEGLTITCEKTALAQITKQRFYKQYDHLSGMTGTALGCEREFKKIYGLVVAPVALRNPSRRQILPMRFFLTAKAKWDAIARSVKEINATGRPVLVGAKSIADSECLADLLSSLGVAFQLLNGRQDAEEAAIISQAGRRGAVTIATNLAGRGTDIKLGNGVAELGGLHVIVADCQDSERVERQLVGRAARQGDPGSAQAMYSAEDALIRQHGSWLQNSIQAHAGEDAEVCIDLSGQVRRIRSVMERIQFAIRSGLMRRDTSRESLVMRTGDNV